MSRRLGLVAFVVVFWSVASLAVAQPPRRPEGGGPGGHEAPQAMVVTRVNVNVDTDVHVTHGDLKATPGDEEEDEDEESDDEGDGESGFGELIESVLKQAGAGPSIKVITDININVQMTVRVHGGAGKDSRPHPEHSPMRPGPGHRPSHAAEGKGEKPPEKPKADTPRKKKGLKKKGGKEQAAVPTPAPAVAAEDVHAHMALSKLKLGKDLEIGVAGDVGGEARAREIANQINLRRQQSLMGLMALSLMVPMDQESLGVIRSAIGSVKAEALGDELSVSAAIPRETPMAVKNLVEAALNR